jgi:hypothetical protein
MEGKRRDALCLPGEDPEVVVAAHHHLAEFHSLDSPQLSALWRALIIVTTAVQFFETLAGAATARLRKLHELLMAVQSPQLMMALAGPSVLQQSPPALKPRRSILNHSCPN